MYRFRRLMTPLAFCLMVAHSAEVAAQEKQATPVETAGGKTTPDTGELKTLGFGTALSMRWNVLSPDVVTDALIDANGIVRVNRRSNTAAGFVLEFHAFPHALRNGSKFGVGPFVSAELGSEQIVSAVGLGLMVGWKIGEGSRGFALGVGYAAIPSAKVLGDEFKENQPAPLGSDNRPLAIRLQERDKGSVILIASFVF